ncbi:hypothetical protein LCGC14_1493910 [marine sediment metagenome]|uniref:Uncharacterized protein n=1 Tax=marine sediment metagenome TaxID=412755 RepID=A0A0F9J5Z0_9ZZZZ
MNVKGLIDSLEMQIDLQDLRNIGLTEKEIEGFIVFEWDSFIGKDLIISFVERGVNDQH